MFHELTTNSLSVAMCSATFQTHFDLNTRVAILGIGSLEIFRFQGIPDCENILQLSLAQKLWTGQPGLQGLPLC